MDMKQETKQYIERSIERINRIGDIDADSNQAYHNFIRARAMIRMALHLALITEPESRVLVDKAESTFGE